MARRLVDSIHPLVQNIVLLNLVHPLATRLLSLHGFPPFFCRFLMDTFSCCIPLFSAKLIHIHLHTCIAHSKRNYP